MPLYRAITALKGEPAARALRDALDALHPAPLASELHDHDDGSGLWDAGGIFDGPPDVAGLALLARLHGAADFTVARIEDRADLERARAVRRGRHGLLDDHAGDDLEAIVVLDRGEIFECREVDRRERGHASV